jgi:hypothetical protein
VGFLGSRSKRTASAKAQFVNIHDGLVSKSSVGNQGGITSTSVGHEKCRLRVTPEDGQPEFESELSLWGNAANDVYYTPGRWTYVLYDPAKPERCEIDRDRLAKEFGLRPDGDKPHMIPRDPAKLGISITGPGSDALAALLTPKPASTADIADQLTKLADLRDRGILTEAEFETEKAKLLAAS